MFLSKFLNGSQGPTTSHSAGSSVSSIFGTGGDAINVLEEYNGYAWKLINIRATTLSSEDLFVEKLVGNKWIEDTTHEFNDVMEGDNGRRDISELLEASSRSLDLYGEYFWYFSKGEKYNKPHSIYLLNPAYVTVLVRDETVVGYVYQNGTVRATLDVDEVLHRRIEDPKSPFRGYGPMQAAGWFIKSSRYTVTYVNNFLENNAIPAGVVVAKGTVNDSDWELFKEQWAAKYGGVDNSGKTGYIRGSDLDFVKTGLSLGDIDVEKIRNSSLQDVLFMFGISKPMAAIFDEMNRANAAVARELFAITHTRPELKALTRKLTKKVRGWYGNQYRVWSTNPVPVDEEAKLNKYDKGVGRWITVNEARADYGLPPIAGGDVIELAKSTGATEKHSKEGATNVFLDKTRVVLKAERPFDAEKYRKAVDNNAASAEKQLCKVLSPLLEEQRDRRLDAVEPKKAVFAGLNTQEESEKIAEAATSILVNLAAEQGMLAMGITGSDKDFDLTEGIRSYIKSSIRQAALSFTEDTERLISEAISTGLEAGESVAELKARIGKIYEDVTGYEAPGYRLERLVRYETIKASGEAAERSYEQSGVVSQKEWYNNPGACEFCIAMNGNKTGLGGTFLAKGDTITVKGKTYTSEYENVMHEPLHVNCRCTTLPVIEAARADLTLQINKFAARDAGDIYSGLEIDQEMLSDSSKRGCIMAKTEPLNVLDLIDEASDDLANSVNQDRHNVPGESCPHITLLYGLLNNGNIWKKQVDKVLKGWSIKTARITEVGYFDTPENIAIVAHIEPSKELIDAHERLGLLPNAKTFSEYRPHMTLAYINKDADVTKWVDSLGKIYNGKSIKITGIDYGDKPEG